MYVSLFKATFSPIFIIINSVTKTTFYIYIYRYQEELLSRFEGSSGSLFHIDSTVDAIVRVQWGPIATPCTVITPDHIVKFNK